MALLTWEHPIEDIAMRPEDSLRVKPEKALFLLYHWTLQAREWQVRQEQMLSRTEVSAEMLAHLSQAFRCLHVLVP